MSFEAYPGRMSEPETIQWLIQYTGNGTGNPTIVEGANRYFGKNVKSVVRTSIGLYTITFTDPMPNQCGLDYAFQGTVPSSLAGFTGVFGYFDATTKIITFSVFNSTFALTDLTAAQSAALSIYTKRAQGSI